MLWPAWWERALPPAFAAELPFLKCWLVACTCLHMCPLLPPSHVPDAPITHSRLHLLGC